MFDKYTAENCYWAGFIAADGYVRKNRATVHIKLAHKDIDHLYKLERFINYKNKVKSYTNYCSIDISGKETKDNLNDLFKITPLKTKTLKFPDIPQKYLNHFTRGYFDGDGCITFSTCPSINVVSASEEFLLKLREIFYDLGVRLKSGNKFTPICNNVMISYSGNNAKIILDWMYEKSYNSIRLERKYLKYKELFGD